MLHNKSNIWYFCFCRKWFISCSCCKWNRQVLTGTIVFWNHSEHWFQIWSCLKAFHEFKFESSSYDFLTHAMSVLLESLKVSIEVNLWMKYLATWETNDILTTSFLNIEHKLMFHQRKLIEFESWKRICHARFSSKLLNHTQHKIN